MNSTAASDLDRAWTLDPQVVLRPERFGALAYNFGTRRLTFLQSRLLVDVVVALREHTSARAACRSVGVGDDELPRYERALRALAETKMITPRLDS
jgi:putative mycofactocin binding protein MftB